jgi:hypothetical protein
MASVPRKLIGVRSLRSHLNTSAAAFTSYISFSFAADPVHFLPCGGAIVLRVVGQHI